MDDRKQKENLHVNHRKRLKQRFLNEGLEHFPPHNVFELLLFFSIPRVDTNETAHRIIDRFGTFEKAFDAAEEELIQVKGVGRETARFIHLLREMVRLYEERQRTAKKIITSSQAAADIFEDIFSRDNPPNLVIMYLNDNFLVLKCFETWETKEEMLQSDFRSFIKNAPHKDTGGFMIAERRCETMNCPNKNDKEFIRELRCFAEQLSLNYYDHIIFADNKTFICSELPRLERYFVMNPKK